MKPYRKIKRNYSKPFFSTRRRGLYGIPLLLFTLAIVSTTVGLIAVAYLSPIVAFNTTSRGYLGLERPEPTLFPGQHAQQGITLYIDGKVEEALAEFEIAVDQRPDNINYLYEYGRILIEVNNFELAAEIGDRAIEAAPA